MFSPTTTSARVQHRPFIALAIICAATCLTAGCGDEQARAELERALREIQLLQDRLQATEGLVNRMYKGYVDAAKPTDAHEMAQAAMDAANAAQACCEANEDRINRMFQIIMQEPSDPGS
jgi:hypothetical protein